MTSTWHLGSVDYFLRAEPRGLSDWLLRRDSRLIWFCVIAVVAGAIAWAGVEAMVDAGAVFGVIDNGGDIALISDRPIRVGVHAGEAPLSDRIAFIVPPHKDILGICTSSATVGPSVSFGMADAVTVFSSDVALADAWATSVCNQIRPTDQSVLDRIDPSEVLGVFALMGEMAVEWGVLPPIVPAVGQKCVRGGSRDRGQLPLSCSRAGRPTRPDAASGA